MAAKARGDLVVLRNKIPRRWPPALGSCRSNSGVGGPSPAAPRQRCSKRSGANHSSSDSLRTLSVHIQITGRHVPLFKRVPRLAKPNARSRLSSGGPVEEASFAANHSVENDPPDDRSTIPLRRSRRIMRSGFVVRAPIVSSWLRHRPFGPSRFSFAFAKEASSDDQAMRAGIRGYVMWRTQRADS